MAAIACAVTAAPSSAATNGAIAVTTPAAPTMLAALTVDRPAPAVVPGLPRDSTDAAWSRDGRTLAFTSTLRGKRDVYATSVSRGLRLITVGDAESFEPTWSPDGRRIAFASRNACPRAPKRSQRARRACSRTADIYVLNLAAGTRRRVTTSPDDDRRPAWSPDGTMIAYESERAGHSDIWVQKPYGDARRKLTSAPHYAATDEAHPAWSPDGATLAFSSGRPGGYAVHSIARSGLDARQLTKLHAASPFPAWSPDGLQIAFSVDRDLLLMPSTGALPADATLLASGAARPAWAAVPNAAATPSATYGVPVIDARSVPLRTTRDARDGVLLTFRPAGARASAQDATALIQNATFKVLRITPQAPTLQISGENCARFEQAQPTSRLAVSARAPKRKRKKERPATINANGEFIAITKHITAAPEGTRYVVSVTCRVEAVEVDTGVVTVKMRKASRDGVRVPAGGRTAVRLVYTPEIKRSPKARRLLADGKGRFRTEGRNSAATVRA